MSEFFDAVYEVVKLVPHGRVTSYGAIARYLGAARSARMVGWAMNYSHHLPDKIPAHRVVNSSGLLTGRIHFGPGDEMKNLLEAEGISVNDVQIENFQAHFWDPMVELEFH